MDNNMNNESNTNTGVNDNNVSKNVDNEVVENDNNINGDTQATSILDKKSPSDRIFTVKIIWAILAGLGYMFGVVSLFLISTMPLELKIISILIIFGAVEFTKLYYLACLNEKNK